MILQSSIPQSGRATSAAKAPYNPRAIRRRIQPLGILPGNVHQFACYSMTREGREIEHRQDVDLETRAVQCSCEDFRYRRAKHHPQMSDTAHHCKHLARALNWLERHHFIFIEQAAAPEEAEFSCGEALTYEEWLQHDPGYEAWRAETFASMEELYEYYECEEVAS
jgi:hypothetical protein